MSGSPTSYLGSVSETWTATLTLGIEGAAFGPDLQPELSAFVHITGDWQGLIMLCATQRLARRVTAAMFDLPPEDVAPEMVHDAFGEMANILAGQVKGQMTGTSALSLPTVVEGDGHHVFVPDVRAIEDRSFTCEGEPIWVRLYEHVRVASSRHHPATDARKEAA